MTLQDDIQYIQSLLNNFYSEYYAMGVAGEETSAAGVPPEMQAGKINDDGWVQWKILPPRITMDAILELEASFKIVLPDLFRAYLMAACQLFDQVHSQKYNQLIFMTDVPSNNPLGPLKGILTGWESLIGAGYIPFAQWGDGWGPMCFDNQQRSDGDCPIVWMDHELLIPIGPEQCSERNNLIPLAQPLYDNTRDFLEDVFAI
ncbi:MAG: SMI1/KNR4 family protein [bacterium]|nr:SMI1/KNR4 family protein [bacterium]